MAGPMGGQPGRQRMVGKGGRKLKTRGFKLGSYVSITYRDPDRAHSAEPNIMYEGKIADKRVGGQDRESYVELKDCLRLNEHGQVIAKEDKKRLMDAFIEECEAVEPREDKTVLEPEPAQMQWGGAMASSHMPMGQMPMVQMPMGQMPMGQMAMGQMPMGQMPMGNMQGQGMSMVPMMHMMPAQGMQSMPMMNMMSMMPMQQMQPMMQGAPQMQMMMMPMMGGGQQMQGGQQMMMVPMMQGGTAAPAASSTSRERSRSR